MMVIFMGTYSGGGGGDSSDDDSQHEETTDDHSQPGLDDYTGDDGNDDSGSDSGSGAGGGPPAGPGGSTGGGGSGGGGVVTEPPEGDDPGDDGGEAEDGEDQEDEEQPESPDVEEPDVEEPEDDVDEPDDTEDADDQKDEDEDEDEEEEEEEVQLLVQEVDPLSAMSWCVQPVMKRVEECYGEEIEFFYKPAPVREFEDPEQAKEKWMECSEDMGMPVDPSFWDNDPPESTELVNKTFEAAIQQGRGMDYVRAMWQRGVAAGRDINDEEVLVELAENLGLDPEQFEEDLEEVELETVDRGELPSTFMQLDVRPASWNGRVRYSDFSTEFTFQGIPEEEPQELQGFVDEYGPVATPEVVEVYGIRREEAEQRLQNLDGASSFEVGGEDFWY